MTDPAEQDDPPTKDRFVDGYLLYLLAAASDKASAQFHERVREAGLRVPEWRVLACLHDNEGMMITDLADRSLMEQSRMTRIIDQMERRSLLARGTDKEDRRRVRIRLTDAGRGLALGLVAEARAHEAALLSDLADTDAARIKTVLQTLLRRVSD